MSERSKGIIEVHDASVNQNYSFEKANAPVAKRDQASNGISAF